MLTSQYEVVVVGAGAAGLTAAIGLARAGFRVAVLEAAPFPGAENWSGCVYFCENLAAPDILGPEGVEALAWERRLVERGFFACDGHGLLGMTYRDPAAFRHCYTVLRPIYDHHLAHIALGHGVALIPSTTVESLIRHEGRIIGVCTNRGALYADLVFLAEGDASHLVTREGYERFADHRETPKFLQGIKQVIELPAGAIEELFGVGPQEGVAYEILLRNGTLRGRHIHLNMGGFVYTNRQSLSLGLVLPADNLNAHFGGDPNLLMEWFANLPALRPWLREGRRGVFGAKLIRGGGAKDIPNLIDEGLAIGGAATAIGVDFPYPNFTGPATAMGLLLARAAVRIRAGGGRFTREALQRHYLEPLQQTHYWRDVDFLRRWPGYVKRTQVFFGRNIDLALGTAYVWTQPNRWTVTRWLSWLRLVVQVAGPGHWHRMQTDFRHLMRALRLREVVSRPALGRLFLDGTLNAFRDLTRTARANLPAAGVARLHYSVAGEEVPARAAPRLLERWFARFAPVLASAARRVYANDDTPLSVKLPGAAQLLMRQMNMIDIIAVVCLTVAAGLSVGVQAGWDRLLGLFRRRPRKSPRGLYARYAAASRQATDLTPLVAPARQAWEARLAGLAYQTVKASHIHVLWPGEIQDRSALTQKDLWHLCPAHVYEARPGPMGQVQVVVNFENCIKCETCWRQSELVDWGRDGRHRLIYPVHSPAVQQLLAARHATGLIRPTPPHAADPWERTTAELTRLLETERRPGVNGHDHPEIADVALLLSRLERKLEEFDTALAAEPRTIDRARGEYLEMLARYALQLAARIVEVLRESPLAGSPQAGLAAAHRTLLELATATAARAEERARRTWDRRFAWAAAGGRQIRFHHVAGMRRVLGVLSRQGTGPSTAADPTRAWLQVEEDEAAGAARLRDWAARLDGVFSPSAWHDLERNGALTPAQDAILRDLVAQVPVPDQGDLAATLHPPERKALLAELGRRDPSLAYRVACHLWARDLARLAGGASALAQASGRWTRGEEWACFAVAEAVQTGSTSWQGEAFFVPAAGVRSLLLLISDHLAVVPTDAPGMRREPLATLGLRGAGMTRVRLEDLKLPAERTAADQDRIRRVWQVLSAADLVSIAAGMADRLCTRAIGHATSRVQFPGLFQDEQARDAIGKFGAVKKLVAEAAARRYLITTLDHTLSPVDFSAASVERAGILKAIVAEALGTAPGSIAYNAGQVFGGTGYSEDDILAKYYRDASAWRYLGVANPEAYRRHGELLLQGWRPDGRRLSSVDAEAELFDQLAQRKALQAELDEVRVLRSRLRSLVNDWHAARRGHPDRAGQAPLEDPTLAAEALEQLGRQDALLLAGKAMLLRTHARLEHGERSETEIALLRVWLEGATVALEEFEVLLRRLLAPVEPRDDRPLVDPGAGPPVTRYADYLAAPCPYESGDFLGSPVNLLQPRLVPEMIETDPELAARDQEIRDLMAAYFGPPRGGLRYERHVERQHRPDPEDLDFCRRHGYFRMPIPRELGGEGRLKIDYYLVTTNAQRLADVALSLTIQANTSIGTTPILLARDKDLPRAAKDLGPFVGDPALQQEIRSGLERVLECLKAGDAGGTARAYQELQKRLEETVQARLPLRVLAHRFLRAWQEAGKAGLDFDLPLMRTRLGEAQAHWQDVCAQAEEYRAELGRRREACDLFLRWIASGQISAFALTEPAAGSDTARVATRARLRSVPVTPEGDGLYRFIPAGQTEPRTLLDARRLEFRPEGVFYRGAEGQEAVPIRFDAYDYETDDPGHTRYLAWGGERRPFTDIAQLRERDGRLWYDYWELTGAKMWITNGRMAGVLCLYAKTEEGVTGFLVDRHAEGLVVGKDEAKLGQCASPTNELSLQAVRVPRENVLGLEGRGQVNALDTLNVGRAGLAMSAMAQMAGLIEHCRAHVRRTSGEIPDWASWRLQRLEETRFISEALAFEVVGRFDHAQTRSVRMESAIAKMLVSELWHGMIELAEDIHGLPGQTELHLVEKRKRDARILNIYEGTNEIQRFFLLKDLATEVAPRWARQGPEGPAHLSREALELEALKGDVRSRVRAALEVFGQGLWHNPNLQANCFLLSEAVAWLKAAECTLFRVAWLDRQAHADEDAEPSPRLRIGRQALTRCYAEVRDRLRRFDEELAHLRRGYYAPEVRAASLLFDEATAAPAPPRPASQVARSLAMLVVVEPTAATVPQPYLEGGKLLEPYWTLGSADRAALEESLRLREEATAPVRIEVAAVAPREAAAALQEVHSLGVDRVSLVLTETAATAVDAAARALLATLRPGTHFDLVLGGAGSPENEEGLLARLVAAGLGIPYVGTAAELRVRAAADEAVVLLPGALGTHPLPAAVGVEAGLPLRSFTLEGYLAGLSRGIETERWPRRVPMRPVEFVEAAETAVGQAAEEAARQLTPAEAAQRVMAVAGLAGGSAAALERFEGPLEDVATPAIPDGAVLAVFAADAEGRLQPLAGNVVQAACLVAECEAVEHAGLVLVPEDEEAQRRAVAAALALGVPTLLLVPAPPLGNPEGQALFLRLAWPGLPGTFRAVVGEPWAELTFAALGSSEGRSDPLVCRVRHVQAREGQVLLETVRAGGKVRVRQALDCEAGSTCWIALAPGAEVAGRVLPASAPRVQRWAAQTVRPYARGDMEQLLRDVQQEAGLARLTDAEFIIDVGYGVGNRDGYEEVIEPLERTLRALGVRGLAVGGSRKVTEELHLLPADRQIGQSGVRVNPVVLLAIGVSGAPQHVDYIGPRATILAFNRDPEAPLLTLNQRRPRPRVFPVVGDLFETVPAFIAALRGEQPAAAPDQEVAASRLA